MQHLGLSFVRGIIHLFVIQVFSDDLHQSFQTIDVKCEVINFGNKIQYGELGTLLKKLSFIILFYQYFQFLH